MYIVKYSGGDWEDYYQADIFVTAHKEVAEQYVEKFNSILKKWKDYYLQFTNEFGWIGEEYQDSPIRARWQMLRMIDECYYREIEIR